MKLICEYMGRFNMKRKTLVVMGLTLSLMLCGCGNEQAGTTSSNNTLNDLSSELQNVSDSLGTQNNNTNNSTSDSTSNSTSNDNLLKSEVEKKEKANESKDLSTIDTIAAALSTAVANSDSSAKQKDTFTLTQCTGNTGDSVKDGVYEQLKDPSKIFLVSEVGKKTTAITLSYDKDAKTSSVEATGADPCKYNKDADGKPMVLKVTR